MSSLILKKLVQFDTVFFGVDCLHGCYQASCFTDPQFLESVHKHFGRNLVRTVSDILRASRGISQPRRPPQQPQNLSLSQTRHDARRWGECRLVQYAVFSMSLHWVNIVISQNLLSLVQTLQCSTEITVHCNTLLQYLAPNVTYYIMYYKLLHSTDCHYHY